MQTAAGELLGVNTTESFQAVITKLKGIASTLDCILLTGDLSQDGSRESYERIAAFLEPLSIPVYFIPGNHDDAEMLATIYPLSPIRTDKHLLFKRWQIILLDSHVPGLVAGKLAESAITQLQQLLDQHTQHALLVMHHHPLAVGCGWLDPLGLQNAEYFWQVVNKYKQVAIVLNGHVHQVFHQRLNHLDCYMSPSTCIQFKPKQVEFALDNQPPGFRLLTLHDDGTHTTEVVRLAAYIGKFNASADGY